jgi:hypothetical protein
MNADGGSDYESLRHFTAISSSFYRQLSIHYEHVFEDWVKESSAECAEHADGGET